AESGDALVGVHLDDGAHETPPVAAVGMAQRRLQRHRDRGRPNIGDLHFSTFGTPPMRVSRPPSTGHTEPVTNDVAGCARKQITSAISSGRAMRPRGCIS